MGGLLDGYRPEQDVADQLEVHIRTLQLWRYHGKAPKHLRKGRDVLYHDDDVRAWLRAGGHAAPLAVPKRRRARIVRSDNGR
jgi:Helix-turn-helix domain